MSYKPPTLNETFPNTVPLTSKNYFKSGIYLLCQDQVVVYVGQSINLKWRVRQHKKYTKKQFNVTHYVFLNEDLDNWEAAYIWKFVPKYNKTFPPNALYKKERNT